MQTKLKCNVLFWFRECTSTEPIFSFAPLTGRLLLNLLNDKTTLDAFVCDHSPIHLTVEAKLRDEFLLEVGTRLLTR